MGDTQHSRSAARLHDGPLRWSCPWMDAYSADHDALLFRSRNNTCPLRAVDLGW